MADRVVVVVNRRARRLVSDGPLLEALRKRRDGVRVVETISLGELDDLARDLVASPPTAVVLAGGDGSYMAGVSALATAFGPQHLPAIGLAPGGTASTVARNWGYSGRHDAATYAARLLERARQRPPRTVARPSLRISDSTGSARVGFIVGAGLVSKFFELYDSEGARGYQGAASIVARIFASSLAGGTLARRILEPVACAIETDGLRARFDRASLVCASVVRNLGIGVKLPYRAGEETERFHFVATPLGPRLLGPQLPLVLAGRPLLGDRVDALAARASLAFAEDRGAYVVDGELFHARDFEICAGPALRVLSV